MISDYSSTLEMNSTNWGLLPENTEIGSMISGDMHGFVPNDNNDKFNLEPIIHIADPYISEERFKEGKQDCHICNLIHPF